MQPMVCQLSSPILKQHDATTIMWSVHTTDMLLFITLNRQWLQHKFLSYHIRKKSLIYANLKVRERKGGGWEWRGQVTAVALTLNWGQSGRCRSHKSLTPAPCLYLNQDEGLSLHVKGGKALSWIWVNMGFQVYTITSMIQSKIHFIYSKCEGKN